MACYRVNAKGKLTLKASRAKAPVTFMAESSDSDGEDAEVRARARQARRERKKARERIQVRPFFDPQIPFFNSLKAIYYWIPMKMMSPVLLSLGQMGTDLAVEVEVEVMAPTLLIALVHRQNRVGQRLRSKETMRTTLSKCT